MTAQVEFALTDASEAFARQRANPRSHWNRSASSDVRSDHREDAATRIFDAFADVAGVHPAAPFSLSDPVFTMGSCFARGIEDALLRKGGRVVSMDATAISTPSFLADPERGFRPGFFNRFTPRAMLQEFQRCFDEIAWTDDTLMFDWAGGVVDLHYHQLPRMDASREAALERRAIARRLARRVADARLIILTLGLTESWVHLPTGLHLNRLEPKLVRSRPDEFAFTRLSFADVVACLEEVRNLVVRNHRTGDFRIVVTVSPVPLQITFAAEDVVVANMASKATLRAAAAEFCAAHPDVAYFPSYEIALYTDPQRAWKPDRVHVEKGAVDWIVDGFIDAYMTGR